MNLLKSSPRLVSLILPALILVGLPIEIAATDAPPEAVGVFESQADVGITPKKGSAKFNAATGEYRVTGSGANMWEAVDAFHFAWQRLSGDVTVSADVRFIGAGKAEHRKAVLMIRQTLDPDSAYADIALHGDGLTALQYRATAGAVTQEIRSTAKAPLHLRIERRGNEFTIYAGASAGELTSSGPVTVSLKDPVYVGIGVCSHDAQVLETAGFSKVRISAP